MEKREMHLPSVDDLFTTEQERQDLKLEKIVDIKLSEIDSFENHPFKIIENDELQQMKDSIIEKGVLSPVLLRRKENGRYEMISGHRRKRACELAGINTIPAIVRDLTDEEATIVMVDSNLQRERILPSEKAFAYKMKLDALNMQGKRNDLTSDPMGQKLDKKSSRQKVAESTGESSSNIQRYIRLTHLIPELLQLTDNDVLDIEPKMGLRPSVEISYLKKDEQETLYDCIECYSATPSLAQAIQMKELSQKNKLSVDEIHSIMSLEKPNQIPKFRFDEKRLRNVLPTNLPRDKVEDYVVKSIEYYTRYLRQRELKSKEER